MKPHSGPIYLEALRYLAKGYAFAAVPVQKPDGSRGLYAVAEPLESQPILLKAATSADSLDRLALAVSMMVAARRDAIEDGFKPLS